MEKAADFNREIPLTARRGRIGALAALVCAALAACAGRTGVAHSEVVGRPAAAPLTKVLLVGMDRRAELRDLIERSLARALGGEGVHSVGSTSYLEFASEPPAREEIRALVDREHFDAILVARLAERRTEYRHVGAADPLFGPPLGFYDYYWRAWPRVYAPTYLEAVRIAALEVRLYDARPPGRLVFTATSEEFELEDVRRAVQAVSEELAETLTRADLVTTAPPARGAHRVARGGPR